MVALKHSISLFLLTMCYSAFAQQENIEVRWVDPSIENPVVTDESYYIEVQVITKKKDLALFVLIGDRTIKSYSPYKNDSIYNIIEKVALKSGENKVTIAYEENEKLLPLDSLTIIKEEKVPDELMPTSSSFSRQDYAIVISNYEYDNWPSLEGQGKNAKMIAEELEESYDFTVQYMENTDLFNFVGDFGNLIDYGCNSTDQLFIFIESHGAVINDNNYIIQRDTEALSNDMKTNVMVSYKLLINMIRDKNCSNVLLMMDVLKPLNDRLFQNTNLTTNNRLTGDALKRYSLGIPTKRYITNTHESYEAAKSEGKPLSALMLKAIRTYGGNDDVLTLSEILEVAEKDQVNLDFGSYDRETDENGEFIFMVK